MVRPDEGAVDHLDGLADPFGIVDRLQQEIPDARQRPPTELPIDRRPTAEVVEQIALLHADPSDPEHAVEDKTMIARTTAAMGALGDDERFEECPFLVAQKAPNHARLLPKATLNHDGDRTGILFVNSS